TGGTAEVYDLEVADNHNFIANGLLVHNCHMLSVSAFNSLLKTLEEPPKNVVFVLATTDPQRVLSTIISRCQRFDFRRIPLTEMVDHLQTIATKENIAINPDAVTLVAQIANGGLRDAESLLDQLSLISGTITVEKVWDLVGAVPEKDLMKLLQAIAAKQGDAVIKQCRYILDRGREPLVVLQNLAGFYRDLLIAKTAPTEKDLVALTEPTWNELITEAKRWRIEEIFWGQKQLKDSEVQIKNTTQPRLWLEVTLLALLAPEQLSDALGSPNREILGYREAKVNQKRPEPENRAETAQDAGKFQTNREETQIQQDSPRNGSSDRQELKINTPEPEKLPPRLGDREATRNNSESPENPQPTPAKASSSSSLAEIWEKVLANLKPPTTQAFVRQQCHLLDFQGALVTIGINSPNIIKIAQQKSANIEAAFQQVFGQKVRVNIEINGLPEATKTEPKPVPEKASELTPQNSKKTPEIPPETQEKKVDAVVENPEAKVQGEDSARGSEVTETTPRNIVASEANQSEKFSANYDDEEVKNAVNKLTEFFQGEVITLEGNFLGAETQLNNGAQAITSASERVDEVDDFDFTSSTIFSEDEEMPF
ncbi:MAG: AAA family ATPase, partial [Oscillatoria sp. PMC 1068.18]|nr:AAA family ATPase [Oscillatoria sp. PMC 1068.18]